MPWGMDSDMPHPTNQGLCVINACDNRPMHIGYRRVSLDDQHPEVQLASWNSVAGR
jgi:hypothetical protein